MDCDKLADTDNTIHTTDQAKPSHPYPGYNYKAMLKLPGEWITKQFKHVIELAQIQINMVDYIKQ